MAYELKRELRLTQNLVMTPQLQLAIKLLQLSRLELADLVREELLVNPVLEDAAPSSAAAEAGEAGAQGESADSEGERIGEAEPGASADGDAEWRAMIDGQESYSAKRIDFNVRDDEDDPIVNASSSGGGLREHLAWQFRLQGGLTPDELAAGEFIIGNIDEDGYFRLGERREASDDEYERAVTAEAAASAGVPEAAVDSALRVVQQLDPPGAGARTFRECLLIQASMLPVRDTAVEEIIRFHLEALARKNYKGIARAIGATLDEVFDAVRVINKSLNPTPGAGFGSDDARAIMPDVYITKVGDDYVISLNEDGMPKLRVNQYYRTLLKGGSREAKSYVADKMKSAVWLIKSVHQRQRTIYKVVECIVRFQRDFLDKGLKYLRPLVLKDVAAEIGVHESTVSRATSNKYVQTPRGLFELKYFFSNGVSAASGGEGVTSEYIKEKVKAIIEGEDSKKPLSDKQIVEVLKESGIVVARRTATKYREALGFGSSSARKAHY